MGIDERRAEIEESIDPDDVVSVVHGIDDLTALLARAVPADAVGVLLTLCRWTHELDRYDDLAAFAAQLVASPHARKLDRGWGRYWAAEAAEHLDGTDPMPIHRALLSEMHGLPELSDDRSPAATALGNRLWGRVLEVDDAALAIPAYESWARMRFATAAVDDRAAMVHRIHDGTLALADPTVGIDVLQATRDWPGLSVSAQRHLTGRLASMLRDDGQAEAARSAFLDLAATAALDPVSLELEISARVQAARLSVEIGAVEPAIDELRIVVAGAMPATEREHEGVALARLSLIEMLLVHRPQEGEIAALAMWEELGGDDSDEVARMAGLALARSWAEADEPTTIERASSILQRFPSTDDPDVRTLVVMALNSRTRALAESGNEARAAADADRAVQLADRGVPDFVRDTATHNRDALRLRRGDYADRDEIYSVARRMADDADAASARGDREQSSRLYERVFDLTRPSEDPKTRMVGLAALRGWTFDLVADGADAQAAEVARRSIEAGIHDGEVGSELLAQAWLHFGIATNRLADRASALHAFAQVSAIAVGRTDAAMRELDSQAAWNLAVLLDDGSAPEDALRAYGGVIARLSTSPVLTDQRRVAKSLKNSAVILGEEVGRPHEAVGAWTEIVTRFDGHPDPELARLVNEARPHCLPSKRQRLWGRRR